MIMPALTATNGWRRLTLKEACTVVTDGTHYSPIDTGGLHPFLTVKDINERGLDFVGCSHISKTEFDKAQSVGAVPQYGDVLFSKDGTVGKVHVVTEDKKFAVLSSIAILRPDPLMLDSKFLGYVLRSPETLDYAFNSKTGSALQRIILDDIKKIPFSVPSISEQKRIAAILDKADRLRRQRRFTQQLGVTFLQSVFAKMFGDPITNSLNFPRQRLEDLIDPRRPITYGILKPGEHVTDGVAYVRVIDMKEGLIQTRGIRRTTPEIDRAYKRSRLKTGDLLLSIRGHVGRLGIVPSILEGANITQDTARLVPSDGVQAHYLMGCLRTEAMQEHMRNLTKGVAVQGINLADVKELPIPIPPLPLQEKFTAIVQKFERIRRQQREATRQAEHLFQTLLHRAFRGEL